MRRLKIPALALELPLLDGHPRRSLSCVNIRHEEKRVVDLVGKWWSGRYCRQLRQQDVMSMLLQLALENPRADLPPGLVEDGRAP